VSASPFLWQRMRAVLGTPWGSGNHSEDVPSGLGRWGLHEFVEPRLRGLVAKHLGVGLEQLRPGVSLRQDLAADSLDLVELALLVEQQFGVSLSDQLLDDVESYGELVDGTVALLMGRAADEKRSRAPLPRVPTRLRRRELRAAAPIHTAAAL